MLHRPQVLAGLLLLVACADPGSSSGPPLTQLYFPTGIAHVDVPGKPEGVLFVSNANFDKRYATGSINALALDKLGLPALGTTADAGIVALTDLQLGESQSVQIATFAGEMAVQPLNASSYRIFVPTRSEGMRVYRVQANIDADGNPSLACIGDDGSRGQNCFELGASLSPREFEQSKTGIPRAPSPYGVAWANRACTVQADCGCEGEGCQRACTAGFCVGSDNQPFADVYVTHLTQADSPALSNTNFRAYLVRLDSDTFSVAEDNFINIGPGGSNSVAVYKNWAYLSGRILSPAPNLMRIVGRDGTVFSTSLESFYRVSDARGISFSSDGKRLYVVGRIPDTLMVLNVSTPETIPTLSFVRGVTLPDAPNSVAIIPRAGKRDLVVVTATSGGSVAIYDDEVGDMVALVTGVGVQPFGIAVDHRGNAARIYVSNFGDGRLSVIDIEDLNRPQLARLVAHLGAQQLCHTRGVNSPGCLAVTTP
ncbi:MAG: hypothetical protein JNM17_02560 [Archangium sp.]|nr:hypothetical protein [Archangium sp.]